jgi:hypothetical protein
VTDLTTRETTPLFLVACERGLLVRDVVVRFLAVVVFFAVVFLVVRFVPPVRPLMVDLVRAEVVRLAVERPRPELLLLLAVVVFLRLDEVRPLEAFFADDEPPRELRDDELFFRAGLRERDDDDFRDEAELRDELFAPAFLRPELFEREELDFLFVGIICPPNFYYGYPSIPGKIRAY